MSAPSNHPSLDRPEAGVPARLLAGWADAQKEAEKNRLRHVPLPNPAANAIPQTKVVEPPAGLLNTTERSALATGSSALILYDTAGQWGYLGELYAMAFGNLAGHFGSVTLAPVSRYAAGQVNQFTATIYIGSTYYDLSTDAVPAAFYSDVMSSSHPVLWINDNIWNFGYHVGAATFAAKYGWDPTNSYFAPNGSVGNINQVAYKSQTLTRSIPAGDDGGILHPYILGGSYPAVTVLANGIDHGSTPAVNVPWAIRSGNLTYIGEIPFEYVNETDRIIALEDLLFDALAPTTATQHLALVRLEDLNASDDMSNLMTVARYLYNKRIPFGFNVIPQYEDPLGYYNNGKPQSISLAQAPTFVTTINYMLTHGGTMIDEGYTHQYSNVKNPYSGVSGDDAEFFLASINSADKVIWNGPIPGDSQAWAAGRVTKAVAAFQNAGLAVPKLWVTPHYFATDVDYRAIAASFPARYERSLYFYGTLSGAMNYGQYIGEFFPYVVSDVYGTKVLPENLGDYEPVSLNGNPVRNPADIVAEARDNLAIRSGFASFFYDPSYGTGPLQQIISGLQGLGYTFVSPASL